jgi:hypothetical protein
VHADVCGQGAGLMTVLSNENPPEDSESRKRARKMQKWKNNEKREARILPLESFEP